MNTTHEARGGFMKGLLFFKSLYSCHKLSWLHEHYIPVSKGIYIKQEREREREGDRERERERDYVN